MNDCLKSNFIVIVAGLSEGQNIPEQIEMQVEHEKESKIESVNKTQDKNVIRKESE